MSGFKVAKVISALKYKIIQQI